MWSHGSANGVGAGVLEPVLNRDASVQDLNAGSDGSSRLCPKTRAEAGTGTGVETLAAERVSNFLGANAGVLTATLLAHVVSAHNSNASITCIHPTS